MKRDFDSLEGKLAELNRTMNIYLSRRVEREINLLRPEMQKVKEIIKDKLGVDIDSR